LIAVSATRTLKPGLWIRLVHFVMLAPDSRQLRRCQSLSKIISMTVRAFAASIEPTPSAGRRGRFGSGTPNPCSGAGSGSARRWCVRRFGALRRTRLGSTTNLPVSQRRTISTFTSRQARARPCWNFGPC
jgi:hypothetical protein